LINRYSTGDPDLDQEITNWIDRMGPTPNADLVHQMIVTSLKMVRDNPDRGDLKIMNTTLKEMRYTWKVFGPYRRQRKVTVFGSARTPEDHPDYRTAEEFSRKMAAAGFMTITGGGNGIMKAGNEGAGRDFSFAANIRLPFEQISNTVIAGDSKLINYKYFFTRKLAFLKESHAVVCCPGGFGTHDEGFETLTLVQTGKSHVMPIVFLHAEGDHFWNDWNDYVLERLLKTKLISPEDLSLYKVTDSVDEAVAEVVNFYRRFHSSRYVGDYLVFRLQCPLEQSEIDTLNEEFGDLLASGKIESCVAFKQEANDPDLVDLPRLKFRFARRRFGRLRQLIDRINAFPISEAAETHEAGLSGLLPDEIDLD
jgi:uncharacterized protein (TIGR00730 family)